MNWLRKIGRFAGLGRKDAIGKRMFAAARPGRLTDGWVTSTTNADTESVSSLIALRNRSRALVRDNAHAKRAKTIIVNNVIGEGIGLQASITNNRGRLVEEWNEPIEDAWEEWTCAGNCHTGGTLHFADMERLLLGEVFEAGDVFVRLHRFAVGESTIPLSLEVIESERIAAEWEAPNYNGNLVRQGVEVDTFGRPVAYWIHEYSPNDPRQPLVQNRLMRVPAEDIIHLRIVDRWPQTRGVPWMHAAMLRLNQLGEFEDSAVVAARIGADKVMVLEEADEVALAEALGTKENDGTYTWQSSKGQIDILPSGTKVANWTPEYPNQNFDPFVRAALRDIAAAFGVSYESLSRDYSQSNYSSSRLALLDDRDGWRVLQKWWIRSFRERLHEIWLEAAILSRSIAAVPVSGYIAKPEAFESACFKARGWGWVDPTKEVEAYREAVRCGFTTVSDVIAATGGGQDLEDVLNQRRRELDMMADADLVFDTDPTVAAPSPVAKSDPTAADPSADPSAATPQQKAQVISMKRDAHD